MLPAHEAKGETDGASVMRLIVERERVETLRFIWCEICLKLL
jgi:hypothetical protein